MQRRLALTLAGSAALVLAAGSAAVAANLGLLSAGSDATDPVGDLDAATVAELVSAGSTTTVGDPVVVYVDEYVTVPSGPGAPGSGIAPTGSLPSPSVSSGDAAATVAPAAGAHDDAYDDDAYEDHDDDEGDHEDEDHEDEDHEDEDHDDD